MQFSDIFKISVAVIFNMKSFHLFVFKVASPKYKDVLHLFMLKFYGSLWV